MSSQEGSVRQLAPGKLNNIKKLFEDGGEGASSNKTEKPMPPARPPAPPSRVKSPVRQQMSQRPSSQRPSAHQQASIAAQAVEQAMQLKDQASGDGLQVKETEKLRPHSDSDSAASEMREHRRLSPTVSRRITALMDKSGTGTSSPSPTPEQRGRSGSGSVASNVADNRVYGTFVEMGRPNPAPSPAPNVSDLYSKVNKPPKNVQASPRKVTINTEETGIQRREAVRKTPDERRKTVASFETEDEGSENSGVSVSMRTKLFDAQKNEKPTPPKKPDSVKRNFSLRTSKEMEQQQRPPLKLQQTRTASEPAPDSIYNPPWDSVRSPAVEKLMKGKPPQTALLPPSAKTNSSSNNVVKSAAPPKPPLPLIPLKKTDILTQRTANKDHATEAGNINKPAVPKTVEPAAAPSSSSSTHAAPPPKPPRTHAHDDYLKVKLSHNTDNTKASSDSQDQTPVKKTVQIVEPSHKDGETEEEVEYMSVKDRISKMQQKTESESSAPLSLPSTSFSNTSKSDGVTMRHQPPSRPPPPRKRPNSGGSPAAVPVTRPYLPRPLTHFPRNRDYGPQIIPVSPTHQPLGKMLSNTNEMRPRRPNDQLPPEPEGGRPLQRFPLRKSFSSECLHSSKGSSLNIDMDDGDDMSMMTHSSYATEYEAVLDPDGYAIPHEFMRLPGKKKTSVPEGDMNDVSPSKFLTRIEGFGREGASSNQNGSPRLNLVTSLQEQNLDKVNKKKMNMVRQKINQAYADLDLTRSGYVDAPGDNDWQMVEPQQEAAESVVEPTVLKKRIEYCASIRLKSSKSIKRSKEYLSAIYPQLFEYCLVVGLKPLIDLNGYEPYVIHKFPENVSSNLSVPSFCFPDASIFKPGSSTPLSESYSFVMTYQDGTRVYGYCRRVQPPDASLPEVICIISPIDAFNMYNTLLREIEMRRRESSDLAHEVIAASFGRPLPKPGKVCHIRTLDKNGDMETIFLNRPSDNKLDNVNYESPLHYLGTDKLVKVFSSMLMERRIMLCSSNLSVLTQTVHALAALLYPFQWQHVYIPILPGEMLDVVCAPMPYIVGVLSAFLPQVLKMELEEVFIVDLDKKSIVKSQGDESTLLPRKVQRALKTAINMPKIDSEARNAQWLMVAEAFLRMFIETVGHFNNHIRTQQDGNRIFQKEGFILEVMSKELREFLEWFTETQMFEVFIGNHVEQSDYGTSDLFMQRLAEYKESKEESSRNKGIGAKVKNFGKALKTKLQS